MVELSFNFDLFNNYYYFYERLIVLLFSLVPSLLLVGFVLYTDRKRKEPSKNIIICLLSGILTVALAGYLEELVMPYFSNNVILTYVWAFIEEISKILIFFLFIFDNKHYDDIYDGLVYMCLISLSFAGLENIIYAFSESTVQNGISLALMRDFTTVLLHVICGIVIGYFISLGNFSKDKTKKHLNFLYAILIATFIHGTFNVLMSTLGSLNIDYSSQISVLFMQVIPLVLIMVILFVVAVKFIRKTIYYDKIYESNGDYDDKHNYLMTSSEYDLSNLRKIRIKRYNKITLKKIKEKDDTNA